MLEFHGVRIWECNKFILKYCKIVCILVRMWLICTQKITSLEKFLEIDHHQGTWLIFKRELLSPMKSEWLSLTSQWKLVVLSFIPKIVYVCFRSSSTWKTVTFRACADPLSRNLTNILQLLEAFQRIIYRLGTNWTCHIEVSIFKPGIRLSISATFYLAGSALCIGTFFQHIRKRQKGC